jgi:hypothetical protein
MREWIWVPLGRAPFDADNVARVFADWTSREGEDALRRAGLGDDEILPLAVAHLNQQMSRRRYMG